MSHPTSSPTPTVGKAEAYVLSLISEGKLQAALEAIGELGDAAVYWPDFHNQAQRLMVSGRLDAAAEAAAAAIAVDPERAQGYATLGEVRLRQARWSAAEQCFRSALGRDSRSSAARFGLGRALRQLGKRRQALEALVTAMEGDPRAEWVAELQRALRRADHRKGVRARGSEGDAADRLSSRAEQVIRRARQTHGPTSSLPTVSVCMIVRDEEQSLPRCLGSVRALAEEVIVVDTGSQDGTVEVAQRSEARVHHFTWCDDFSAARNESLRHATRDWILVLDGDDELGNPAGLKEYLAQADGVNVCSMRTRIPHHGQAGETIVEHPRLFRNGCGLHYRGPVHEQLCDAAGNPAAAEAALDLQVYHHGYLEDEGEQIKRHQRNLRILRAWIERCPEDAWAHFCLGQAHYTNREMEQAIPALTMALRYAAPDRAYRAKVYAYLASAQTANGRAGHAEQTCRDALAEFPDQAELLFCLGHALECQGKAEDAVEAYQAATRGRFGPMLAHHDFTCRDLKPLARLAEIHASHGRLDEAEDCLRRVEGIRGRLPALDDLRQRIASARRLRRETAVAEEVFAQARAAVTDDPTDAAARLRLAALLLGSGNSAEAQQHAEALLEMDPACAEALNLKGVILCTRGILGAAVEHLQRAVALRPGYADALANLGAARLRLNDLEGAEAAFREAAEGDPSCFAAHLALGEIHRSRGRTEQAIERCEAAVRADPSAPAAWLGLARCYLAAAAYEPAARCYARAVETGGPDPQVMGEIQDLRRRLARNRPAVTAGAAAVEPPGAPLDSARDGPPPWGGSELARPEHVERVEGPRVP